MYKKFLFLVFIYTLFSFKFSILGNSTDDNVLSSIRIDDIIIVIVMLVYFLRGNSLSFFLTKKVVFFFILYVMTGVFSSIFNSIYGEVDILSSLLFSLRPLEYFLYIILGFELARYNVNIKNAMKFYVIYCLILIFGQTLGFIGGISNFSFNRAIANTGGPWELAAVSAFLVIYFSHEKIMKFTVMSLFILILTQSRITLIGTGFVFFVKNIRNIKDMLRKRWTFLSGIFVLIFSLAFIGYGLINFTKNDVNSSGIISRINSFVNNETVNELLIIYENTKPATNRQDYFNQTYDEGLDEIISNASGGDASAFIRFTRWVTLVKTVIENPATILVGLGPSYAGKAIDGNYVRIFVETGFLGLITFIIFLTTFFKYEKNKLLIDYMIVLSITAIFIDIFVTFKAMFLFWMFYGRYLFCKLEK